MLFVQEEGSICFNDGQDVVVFPLMKEELKLLIEDQNYFENYLNLKYDARPLKEVKETYEFILAGIEEPTWALDTLWVVASIKYKSIVGTLSFKRGESDIELNFYTHTPYRRQGIMTAGVKLVCDFLKDKTNKITAYAPIDNVPAIKVLENNDFTQFAKDNALYFEKEIK